MKNQSDTERFYINPITYNFKNILLDDPRIWSLYQRGDTKGIFQVESQLCVEWCKKIKPQNIDELAALISLVRPGGLEAGMAEKYAKIKNGLEEPSYIHPALEPILNSTYSCLVFQETILEICKQIAGFDEIQADNVRKAVGKKLPEEMAKVKIAFLEGAKKKAIVSDDIAQQIFDWIEKSVRYLFNAGHSYSYAYTSVYTAFQKVFYPTEFYCSWLTFANSKPDPQEERAELINDAKLHNISILPPDIQRKNSDFEIIDDKKIIFGLSHIRGVGKSAIENIQNEKIESFNDLIKATHKLKRNVVESLIKSGACHFDGLGRSQMLRIIYAIYGRSNKEDLAPEVKKLTDKELRHFLSVFENVGIDNALQSIIDNKQCVSKRICTIQSKIKYLNEPICDTNTQIAIWEKLYLGIALSTSAVNDVQKEDGSITCKQAYNAPTGEKMFIYAVLDSMRMRKTSEKSKTPGKDFCYLTISDSSCQLNNLVCWPEIYEKVKENLIENTVIAIKCKKENWNNREQINVFDIEFIG